jgi:AcrR family transcriptional regulator
LEGAARLLGKRGSADVTVEEILRASKISRATFYRFFQNKEEVLDALYEVWTMTLAEAMRSVVVGDGTGLEKLQRALEQLMRFHTSVGPLIRVLQAESQRPGSSLVARKEVLHQALADLVDSQLRLHYDLRVDPLVLRALIVTLEGVSAILLRKNEPIDTDRALRVMLRVVVATLSPEGSPLPPLPLAEK